ncbi:MAG TPA: hypothetical protein VGJ22_08765 [Anaerolineales bacterium]
MQTDRSMPRRWFLQAPCLAGLAALPATAAGRAERLQITKVELFKVIVPMQEDIISSPEFGTDALTEFPGLPKFIVKLHTDSGIVGIGETSRDLKEEPLRGNAAFLQGAGLFP